MLSALRDADSPLLIISIWAMPVLWVVGMVTSFTMGGLIHILPALSLTLLLLRFSREEATRPGDKGPRMKSSKPYRRTN